MSFKRKTEKELSEMTATEREQYGIEKDAAMQLELKNSISEAIKELPTSKDVEEQIKTLKEALAKEGISKDELKELQESVAIIKESTSGAAIKGQGFDALLEKALTEALPTLKAWKTQKGTNGTVDRNKELIIEIKAAVNVTTGAVANAGGVTTPDIQIAQDMTDYAVDIRKDQYIINFLDNGNTAKASLPYMDKQPNEGTMTITAEGALKPLISVSFKLEYSQAEKIAGRMKVSEESLDDLPFLMSTIKGELKYEHDIAEQAAVFTKIAAIASAFVAGDMAASTTDPTNYDAIRAAIYCMKIASQGKFRPNAVLVPSADAYNMGATKDKNNQYVMPPFVLPDGTKISGVQVIEVNDDTVAAGSFILGDFKRLRRRVYKGFTVRIGQGINFDGATPQSDFESNMYTLVGESRLHLYIYTNEKPAFIKSTFAAVKTAIELAAVV